MSAVLDAPSPPKRAMPRRVIGLVGEILLTLGVVALLFVVYQVWWTGVLSARAADVQRERIVAGWASPADPQVKPPAIGEGFALLYIPGLRDKVWGLPVIEGVGLDVLAEGAGHYPGTALPGQIGNFAVAAHRATHDEPFRDFDQLQVGDKVYVQTKSTWYTYELRRDQIVRPTDTWVIDPVPGKPTATPTEALITLTTCNPRWASYERWVWWGDLTAQVPTTGPAPINPER